MIIGVHRKSEHLRKQGGMVESYINSAGLRTIDKSGNAGVLQGQKQVLSSKG